MNIFTDIARQLHIDIAMSDDINGNGSYDPRTGKLTLNAASTREQNLGYIFMHETTHHLRLYAPEQWNKLVNLVKRTWSARNADQMNKEIDAKIELYKEKGNQILSRDQALEEIIADSAHEFLLDEQFATDVCAEDMGLAKAVLNSIRSTLEKLRAVISNNYTQETGMRSLFSELDILEEAERIWLNAYKEAYKNSAAVGLVEWNERNGQKLSASVRNSFGDGTRYSISEEQDRAYNEDIRFSFDGPVERVKDLVAVHNLKQDDIQNALKLGGFPMPSIAVTKDNMGHEMYGDVTLMFHSDTIDPKKNKENKVYGGDAYTPVFPSIRFKPSEKIANNIRDIYYDNVSTLGYDAMNPMYRLANNIENELNDAGGESALKEKYKNNTSLMRTFLKMNDKDVEDVISRTESSMTDEEIRLNQTLIDSLGEDVIRSLSPEGMRGSELMEYRRQWVMDNKEALENAYTEYFRNSTINFSDEQIRGFLDDMKPGAYVSAVRKALTYLENGPTTIKEEIDRDATEKKIKQAAAENGYEAWVDSLLDGVEEKQGIRNNADAFTRSGSRRKWESLHDPVTLENVVRVMRSELDAGGNGLFGANPKGASQKKYRNLDDVRADEGRLQQLSDEEYKKQSESALSKFTSVCQSIYDHNKDKFYNPFGATMDIGGGIAEVLNETRTKAGIKSKLTKEFNWNVSDAEMDDLMNAIDAIANIPTGYFEAKPRRAVGFDEVKAAIVPDGMDRNVLDSLRDRGVSVYEYDPARAGDRTEKVNEAATDMDLRFSISEEDNHDYAENQIIGEFLMSQKCGIRLANLEHSSQGERTHTVLNLQSLP